MKTCSSCGAEILFAMSRSGKRIPLDAAPVGPGAGRFVLVKTETPAFVRVPSAPIALAMSGIKHLLDGVVPALYVSHFSTCPDAAKHRRR